jgi:hypothetical protein
MNILKAQKVIRKAIKDYSISSNLDEDTLVNVLSVKLWEEEMAPELPAIPVRVRKKDSREGSDIDG